MTSSATEPHPLDDALTVFAATAPEFGRFGLSNHGPMGAEVLGRLGHSDAIPDWVAAYAVRLDAAPPPAEKPLGEADWPTALGAADSFPAWLALFERELADRPMAAVVGEWVPRLVPGTIGARGTRTDSYGPWTSGLRRGAHIAPAGRSGDRVGLLGLEVSGAAWTSTPHRAPRCA